MHHGIVVIGSIFVDIKGYPYGVYLPAGRNAGRVEQVHGGVCRNVAEDIARIGLQPVFLSLADESGISTDVIDHLSGLGCRTDYIHRTEDGLGTWLAVFDHSGDVVASISRRPDMRPLTDVLARHGTQLFSASDSIALEIDMDKEVLDAVISLAEAHSNKVFAVVSNMSIAVTRRDILSKISCLVCNEQEAGILFSCEFDTDDLEILARDLSHRMRSANIRNMVVTLGDKGSVWADESGACGVCPAMKVDVCDTTGCGDAFFAGVTAGLTYGKTLAESCVIGTRLAASVICTTENVCPSFQPQELGLA